MLCKTCGKPVEPQFESTGRCEDCFANVEGCIINDYDKSPDFSSMSKEEILELSIVELEIASGTSDFLHEAGVQLIKHLVQKGRKELKTIKHIGDTAVDEIEKELQTLGLSLRGQQW